MCDGSILHLEEELRLEAAKERRLWVPQEMWSLNDLKRSLRLVSDEAWFQEGGGMIDFRVFGPNRASTFGRVFSDVPGAIYGCLKVCRVHEELAGLSFGVRERVKTEYAAGRQAQRLAERALNGIESQRASSPSSPAMDMFPTRTHARQ